MLTRLLGFTRLDCGCLASLYRDRLQNRDVRYVEDRGAGCRHPDHQQHQAVICRAPSGSPPHHAPAA